MECWLVSLLITIVPLVFGVILAFMTDETYKHLKSKKFSVSGKHCYVTGGSSGLGKALAIELARRGAHITIVARNAEKLKTALLDIKMARLDPQSQRVVALSADVCDHSASVLALRNAVARHGGAVPEYVFTCAGMATPGMMMELSTTIYKQQMDLNYFGSLYTIHEAARMMVKARIQGHLVFVSSLLGLFGLIGYSPYAPTKFAIRGLAETLRSELQAYGISVHCYFPGTMFTEGYEIETMTKPDITKLIEGADSGATAEQSALSLLNGIKNGRCAITTDFIGTLFRCNTRGTIPMHNIFIDTTLAIISWIAVALWRVYTDFQIGRKAPTLLRSAIRAVADDDDDDGDDVVAPDSAMAGGKDLNHQLDTVTPDEDVIGGTPLVGRNTRLVSVGE